MDIICFDKSLTHVRLMNHNECIKCLNNTFNNKYILRNISAFINVFFSHLSIQVSIFVKCCLISILIVKSLSSESKFKKIDIASNSVQNLQY